MIALGKKHFSCYIIGETSLTINCAKIILSNHHNLLGILSLNEEVKQWATTNGVNFITSLDNFQKILVDTEVDYIFSIVNSQILSKEIIKSSTKFSINYHDSLLPSYAGIHATSWAILNNESKHGITWHIMESSIDSGDILKQTIININPNETAVSLNIKCYEQAIKDFEQLVYELSTNTFKRIKQNPANRSYYGLNAKIPGNGIMLWQSSAEEINRVYRALSFGNYNNKLGLPKVLINNSIFIPKLFHVLNSSSNLPSGTISQILDTSIYITTTTNDVEIGQLINMDGMPYTISYLVEKFNLTIGTKLPIPSEKTIKNVTSLASMYSKYEVFWIEQLRSANPATIPFSPHSSLKLIDINSKKLVTMEYSISLSNTASEYLADYKLGDSILTLFLIVLYRMEGAATFSIAYQEYSCNLINDDLKLFSEFVPLNISFNETLCFKDTLIIVMQQIEEIRRNGKFLKDLLLRNPQLKSSMPFFSIAVIRAKSLDYYLTSSEYLLTIVFSDTSSSFKVIINNYFIPSENFKQIVNNISLYIQTLLESTIKDPNKSIGFLSIISQNEKLKILQEQDNVTDYYSDSNCIIHLFEEQVKKARKSIAVMDGSNRITYQELNEKANQLAHYLKNNGVGPEIIVAVSLERSIEFIISILGILKAGGAYLPLDSEYPEERLLFMLKDSQALLLITNSKLKNKFSNFLGRFLLLDKELDRIKQESNMNPKITIKPQDLAYIIYTSGSTGKPKGVMIEHRGICNLAISQAKDFIIDSNSRVLQFASLSFDAAVSEWTTALTHGATLCLFIQSQKSLIDNLNETITNSQVTVATLPPSFLNIIPDDSLSSLKTLVVAGEPCNKQLINKWSKKVRFINAYGPTETTVCASMAIYIDTEVETVTIGRPISNTQIYLLDKHMQLVPAGFIGELYIGGIGLARGYLNQDELTHQKFISNPFSGKADRRLFKTGDLARYLPNGEIEFLSRADHQIKIRGYRVEIGEIESILLQLPSVQDNLVVLREDVPNQQQLVAYIIAKADITNNSNSTKQFIKNLNKHLADKLPSFMLPTAFILLKNFPFLPNGKIDRNALPAPNHNQYLFDQEYVAPSSDLHKQLVTIYSSLLSDGLKIGIEDSFFKIGGNSLLATQLIIRLRQILSVELSLQQIFQHPTISSLANEIVKLKSSSSVAIDNQIKPISRDNPIPLASAQLRLWFLDQYLPNKALYNINRILHFNGPLNTDILEKSLNQLLTRHELLQVRFITKEGVPFQVVDLEASFKLQITDLSSIPVQVCNKILQDYAKAEALKPFNLTQAPLIRGHLLRLNDNEHVLLLTMHHIVADGWSIKIINQELSTIYNAYCAGKHLELPVLGIQYFDYAVWQQSDLKSNKLKKQFYYWKDQLADLSELVLPTDRARPAEMSYKGGHYHCFLSTDIYKNLQEFTKVKEVTLYTSLLAVFHVLLHRYSDQDDIVIGTAIANRQHIELENLIGCFVNSLALRTNCSGNPSFNDFLKQVHNMVLQAYAHQDAPFEQIVDLLQIKRDVSKHPIFQVMFVLQNMGQSSFIFNNVTVQEVENTVESVKFDLLLEIIETQDGLKLVFEYATDLFDEDSVKKIAIHYIQMLNFIINHSEVTLEEIPFLTFDESQQLLVDWNNTEVAYPNNQCIHQLISAQAIINPMTAAVVYEEEILTYQELNKKANQLAHYLVDLGIKRGSFIAISMEYSLELIVGILGILKSGAAYVPLDPTYPQERLNFMLSDIDAKILLTQSSLEVQFKDFTGELIKLDTDWTKIESKAITNLKVVVKPEDLAYIIYTSGSTGQPKGVCVKHCSVINLLYDFQAKAPVGPEIRGTLWTNISFDVSVYEITSCLLFGGTLHVLPDNLRKDDQAFFNYLCINKITSAYIPAFFLNNFYKFIKNPKSNITLTRLLVGVEPISYELLLNIVKKLTNLIIINGYGPSEATICATLFKIDTNSNLKNHRKNTPIGKPVSNLKLYVLNRHQQLVPKGAIGELYIGGVGLALGYLNLPKLTDEKFIFSPFNKGSRLYRTGDLVRYLPDGNLEFLGRIDHQVKFRGYRIELGEIEAILREHEVIQNAVVLIHKDDTTYEPYLIAYIVLDTYFLSDHNESKSRAMLYKYLVNKLPNYMVPSILIFLEKMPLTSNGKIDHKALISFYDKRQELSNQYYTPKNNLEKKLVYIWSCLLPNKKIGIYDNFFELGGHSLLATQVVSKLHSELNVNISLPQFFKLPSIAALADYIQSQKPSSDFRVLSLSNLANNQESIPLSFAQQRLWFLQQLIPQSGLYNVPLVFHFRGLLIEKNLELAINTILQRHESLRTVILNKNAQLSQVIVARVSLVLTVIDFTSLSAEHKNHAVMNYIDNEANTPFDLSKLPLIRAQLLKLNNDDHLFLITMHHIVADGWSISIFFQELSELYNAFLEKRLPKLPIISVQYKDFSCWQRDYLNSDTLANQFVYWKKQLKDAPSLLQLSTDKVRPRELSYKGSSYFYSISEELLKKLTLLAQERDTTLFMMLLASFQILLHRYSGQDDIVVGFPIANRQHAELENVMGFFINSLALRTHYNDEDIFSHFLNQVKQITLDAYEHQDVPFEYIVENLYVNRDASKHPLFQVMFNYQKSYEENLTFNNLIVKQQNVKHQFAKFDLTLDITEHEYGLSLAFEYATDLFNESTILRMAAHFEQLLTNICANPYVKLEELQFLTETERYQLLVTYNDSAADYPKGKCIHQLFEKQVLKTPEATAVVYQNRSLSYQKLNAQANQLARYLRTIGVGPNIIVVICAEYTLETIIGILAIVKAGGVFAPIDPNYPEKRLQYMLNDANPPIFLTQSKLLDKFQQFQGITFLLDKDWSIIEHNSQENLDNSTTSDNLVHAIYTSGTTGNPKASTTFHRSFVNLLYWYINEFNMGVHTKKLIFSSFSFDLTHRNIFCPLLCGGQLHLIDNKIYDVNFIINYINNKSITSFNCTPSAFYPLLEYESGKYLYKLQTLRHIFLGGEPISTSRLKSVNQPPLSIKIVNLYGPCECADVCAYYCLTSEDIEQSCSVPIGKANNNALLFVLDEKQRLVPSGAIGELYISGLCVGKGYLGNPELTAEKFITDPIEKNSGRIFYRTGDLVRYLVDGNLEFLGRIDHQIKFRGYRIELGEIESLLRSYKFIRDAVVVVREDIPGLQRLVAYIECEEPQSNDNIALLIKEIRNYIKLRLPDFMVPALFVYLPALPLTANGKVDRNALPIPDDNQRDLESVYVPPRNNLENALARIYSELLSIKDVSIYDDFFSLGGHSLLATRLISRINQLFEIELSLRILFANPTIIGLAESIQQIQSDSPNRFFPLVAIKPRPKFIPLSFAQQRLWIIDQLIPNSGLYNIPLAFSIKGELKIDMLSRALNKLVERHEILRTIIGEFNGEAVQIITNNQSCNLQFTDLQNLSKEENEQLLRKYIHDEAYKPFDLMNGLLIRGHLFKVSITDYVFLLTTHHIISDGWSGSILCRELSTYYNAYSNNNEQTFLELDLQYADFAIWQRAWLTGEILEKQLLYWQKQLIGVTELLQLPTDKPRPKEMSYQGELYTYHLSKELTKELNQLSDVFDTTLFMTLLTIFNILLAKYSGVNDIVIGTPIANRRRIELEQLIGFFVNTLVLRTNCSEYMSFGELLKKVKETAIEAYENQDVPFELLLEKLNVQRNLSHNSLFQVLFALQNIESTSLNLEGTKVDSLSLEAVFSKFDLALYATETTEMISLQFVYSKDLFNKKTIVNMAAHFEQLVKDIVKNPQEKIGNFSLLTIQEQKEILFEWNNTYDDYPKNLGIHHYFEDQVLKTPNQVAVEFCNSKLTYNELNKKANQLANYLINNGVGPEVTVGLCVERSLEAVISLLAIFKAGGVYVPLDPSYSAERLKFMLTDSNIKILILQSKLLPSFRWYNHKCFLIDLELEQLSKYNAQNLSKHSNLQDLAYLIYTSGSTGMPKGVLGPHLTILNRFLWMWKKYPFQAGEVYPLITSLVTNDSMWELLGPISQGAKLVVIPDHIIKDTDKLVQLLHNVGATRVDMVPSYLKVLLDTYEDIQKRLPLLKFWGVNGEALPKNVAMQFAKLLPESILLSRYGATEATTVLSQEVCIPGKGFNGYLAGKPTSNSQVYILDEQMQPLPVGISGQLYIGGHALARGYLNLPDLTQEKFIIHKFNNGLTIRLYKTGDMARYLADGTIEILGRNDYQVKIRGYRIELNEIEFIINQYKAVKSNVVIIRNDHLDENEKQMIAYIVTKFKPISTEDEVKLISELRQHVAVKLPNYMVPTAFILLENLPLTFNGKIDRKMLPAPEKGFQLLENSYIAPRTDLEKKIHAIWLELLGKEKVGVYEDFFNIGGHSLLATQMISRLRNELNTELSLRSLFLSPTIAGMAEHITIKPAEISMPKIQRRKKVE